MTKEPVEYYGFCTRQDMGCTSVGVSGWFDDLTKGITDAAAETCKAEAKKTIWKAAAGVGLGLVLLYFVFRGK